MKSFLLFGTMLLLSSCGFHLRGYNTMPQWINNIGIVIQNAHRDLGPTLKDQLEAFHIQVNPDPSAADYLLIIESDAIQQQIKSIAASTVPRQYLLVYAVRFSVVQSKGPVLIPSTLVSVSRQLTLNNDRILGSNFEEMQLTREMRTEAALQIINRLSREKIKPQTSPRTLTH